MYFSDARILDYWVRLHEFHVIREAHFVVKHDFALSTFLVCHARIPFDVLFGDLGVIQLSVSFEVGRSIEELVRVLGCAVLARLEVIKEFAVGSQLSHDVLLQFRSKQLQLGVLTVGRLEVVKPRDSMTQREHIINTLFNIGSSNLVHIEKELPHAVQLCPWLFAELLKLDKVHRQLALLNLLHDRGDECFEHFC